MKSWFYFRIDITDSAIGQYVSFDTSNAWFMFSFFLWACGRFLSQWMSRNGIIWTQKTSAERLVTRWRHMGWHITIIICSGTASHSLGINNECLSYPHQTPTHWPAGDVAVSSIMPFSNTCMEGWNVEQFLSNYPNLNADGPHWNTNKSPWHFKKKSTK